MHEQAFGGKSLPNDDKFQKQFYQEPRLGAKGTCSSCVSKAETDHHILN